MRFATWCLVIAPVINYALEFWSPSPSLLCHLDSQLAQPLRTALQLPTSTHTQTVLRECGIPPTSCSKQFLTIRTVTRLSEHQLLPPSDPCASSLHVQILNGRLQQYFLDHPVARPAAPPPPHTHAPPAAVDPVVAGTKRTSVTNPFITTAFFELWRSDQWCGALPPSFWTGVRSRTGLLRVRFARIFPTPDSKALLSQFEQQCTSFLLQHPPCNAPAYLHAKQIQLTNPRSAPFKSASTLSPTAPPH